MESSISRAKLVKKNARKINSIHRLLYFVIYLLAHFFFGTRDDEAAKMPVHAPDRSSLLHLSRI